MSLPVDEKVLHCHLEQKKGKDRKTLSEHSCFGIKQPQKQLKQSSIQNLFNQEILRSSKDAFCQTLT